MPAGSRWPRVYSSSVMALALCACGPIAAVPDDETSSGTTGSMPSSSTSTGIEPGGSTSPPGEATGDPTNGTSSTSSTTSTVTSDDGGSHAFIVDPDGSNLGGSDCDVWTDDCQDGDKCMPWANDGGNAWNATRCSPIAEDARDVGEPCTVEGSGVSGLDDCVAHAMCWDVDPETNEGTCVGFCSGSEANPSCSMPCDHCTIANDGVLILCLPSCDPLVQDCSEGGACWPSGDKAFQCMPDAGSKGSAGDPCFQFSECTVGLACIDPERVPGCESDTGCCASFCDTADEEACVSNPVSTTCVPWFGAGESPPCISQTIGVCALPEGA